MLESLLFYYNADNDTNIFKAKTFLFPEKNIFLNNL